MYRPIIFRAKTIKDGEWVQSMTIANGTIERKKHNLYMEVGNDKWKDVDPDTLGQYTGVDDKNGKRIFEGDIVRVLSNMSINGWVGFVKYQNGCFGVVFNESWLDFHPLHLTSEVVPDMGARIELEYTFEVLGNIFDDSQILAN